MSDLKTLIIDNGAFMCRAGFADDDTPKVSVRNTVARKVGNEKDVRVGCDDHEPGCRVSCSIEGGLVTNWDAMDTVLKHVIEKMELSTSDFQVLITDSAPDGERRRQTGLKTLTQLLFEEFHVKGVHVASQSALSVLSSGKSTGVAVSLGHSVFHVVPVYEGYTVAPAGSTFDICAKDINSYLGKLMYGEGSNIEQDSHWLREIKEQLTYVSLDSKAEKASDYEKSITLPNGQQFTVKEAQFMAPEILFVQDLHNEKYSSDGIVERVVESVKKCPVEFRPEFYENIVLSGGSSKFPGLAQRVEKDLKELLPKDTKFNIYSPPNPELAVWRGACMLAKSDAFEHMVFTSEEYDDGYNLRLVTRKYL